MDRGRGESRPPKTPEAVQHTSIKVQNRLHMRTNLHRKQETYLQGGENLYMKRYFHKAQMAHPGPWTPQLHQCWDQNR